MDTPPEFDRYARDYARLHGESIRASGEEPAYFAASKAAYVARAVAAETPARLLDFGCGIGGTLGFLRDALPRTKLHGMDVSRESLAMAAQAHPDVALSAIEGDRLAMDDDVVDVAVAACVFHHIAPAERAKWLGELRRVLKPGGRLFVFEHNPWNPLTRKVVDECPFDEDAILLSSVETRGLMRDAGFEHTHVDYTIFFPHALAALRPLERLLTRVPMGAQYVASGRA
jgi:ubiquinone/menaquinone biosynthesis C-methylase UbiE